MTLTWNRRLSGVLALLYVLGGFATGGGEAGFKVLLGVILPLACIWFGDAMGGFTGQSGSVMITEASPGIIVCILGWVLLLLPILFMSSSSASTTAGDICQNEFSFD